MKARRKRQRTVGPAIILAEGVEGDMRSEVIESVRPVFLELNLKGDGICFEVNQPFGGRVFGKRDSRAMKINEEVARTVKGIELAPGHSVIGTIRMKSMKGPAIGETETLHDIPDERSGRDGTVEIAFVHQFSRSHTVRFDVIRFKAEAFEAEEVVNSLPDNTSNRVFADHPEHDNFRFRNDVHQKTHLSDGGGG